MITVNFLTILPFLLATEGAYPTTRGNYGSNYGYGGSVLRSSVQWGPYVPVLRTQRSPIKYYTLYPYSQSYLEDYYRSYPQETYPVYYPRPAKYDLYHAAVPSYYHKPDINNAYDSYYLDVDPAELQEEILQEVEREEREESQPIGHEMLYENEDYAASNMNKYDQASLAYFQNMLAQKNKDLAYKQQKNQPIDYVDDYDSEWQDIPATRLPLRHQIEDKEVQDLRKLKYRSAETKQNVYSNIPNDYYNDKKMYNKRHEVPVQNTKFATKHNIGKEAKLQMKPNKPSDTKPTVQEYVSTTSQSSIIEPKKNARGQKEEVMMRPATPVRHPFNAPLLDMMANGEDRKRNPSVFDTLKHILEMEKALKNKYEDDIRPIMKKRIISDEDSLAHQLTVLKKSK
ncbi:hypothetical protein WA026_006027 [Henosepilachna vigintioctopunctata]|uniref:Uncharacterized protein n=1 Tax=Henosepilachna vigintioctopunctata TaxID=420089 RepID=A0AAW1TQ90_9CUCU